MDLIKKWRNLRDTFKRQIQVDKKIDEGQNIKKKKYVYYKPMSFLLPHIQLAQAQAPPEPPPAPRCTRHTTGTTHADDADALLSAEYIDEDKHFLMSLLPSFKRMNDDEELTAKMEILNVIKNVRGNSSAVTEPYKCRLQVVDVKTEVVSDVDAEDVGDPNVCAGAEADAELSECSDLSGHAD